MKSIMPDNTRNIPFSKMVKEQDNYSIIYEGQLILDSYADTKSYIWIVLDMNMQAFMSKCTETDNKQVGIVLQDRDIPRKKSLHCQQQYMYFN